jgi:ABC-2 type transport system ATP-binding protein
VRRLSGGQQRRLDVAIGLAGDPDLLFLDEPTTGFDPSARRQAWEMIKGLRALGKTVLLTTHYMDEAEELADRVAIIARGVIVAEGRPRELMAHAGDVTIAFRLPPGELRLFEQLPGIAAGAADGVRPDAQGRVTLHTDEPTALLHALTGRALERGVTLVDLSVSPASLEDVYLQLTGDDAVAGAAAGAATTGA